MNAGEGRFLQFSGEVVAGLADIIGGDFHSRRWRSQFLIIAGSIYSSSWQSVFDAIGAEALHDPSTSP